MGYFAQKYGLQTKVPNQSMIPKNQTMVPKPPVAVQKKPSILDMLLNAPKKNLKMAGKVIMGVSKVGQKGLELTNKLINSQIPAIPALSQSIREKNISPLLKSFQPTEEINIKTNLGKTGGFSFKTPKGIITTAANIGKELYQLPEKVGTSIGSISSDWKNAKKGILPKDIGIKKYEVPTYQQEVKKTVSDAMDKGYSSKEAIALGIALSTVNVASDALLLYPALESAVKAVNRGIKVPNGTSLIAWEKLGKPATLQEATAANRAVQVKFHPDINPAGAAKSAEANAALSLLKKTGIPKQPGKILGGIKKATDTLLSPLSDLGKLKGTAPILARTLIPEKAGTIPTQPYTGYKPAPSFGLSTKEIKAKPIESFIQKAEQSKMELSALEQVLNEPPFDDMKKLAKYAIESGKKLPEVGKELTGANAKTIFGRYGDEMAAELGFADSEELRRKFEEYVVLREKYNTLKASTLSNKELKNLSSIKDVSKSPLAQEASKYKTAEESVYRQLQDMIEQGYSKSQIFRKDVMNNVWSLGRESHGVVGFQRGEELFNLAKKNLQSDLIEAKNLGYKNITDFNRASRIVNELQATIPQVERSNALQKLSGVINEPRKIQEVKSQLTDIWNKANVGSKVDPLITEARKYKSAEEFVKANTYYRGQDYSGELGAFYTTNVKEASQYGNKLFEAGLSPSDIYKPKVLPKPTSMQIENAIEQAKKGKFKALLLDEGTERPPSIYIFDKKAIKTKSQLTDIWNQANRPKQAEGSILGITKKAESPLVSKAISESKAISSLTSQNKAGLQPVEKAPELANTIETKTKEVLSKASGKYGQKASSLPEIINNSGINVKDKVNIIDYVRTPDRVLEKIGLGQEAKQLRKGYENYILELPKNIEKITEWSKQVPHSSNIRIFQYLDGKEIILDQTELRVANEVKSWLKNWADRLGLPADKRITNYITHIFDKELISKEFDADLAKILADKIPGEIYDPFLLSRLGKRGFKQDTWQALDAYVKRATRKVNIDPALEAIKKKTGSSLETTGLEKSQFDYVQKYIAGVNMRPTDIDNLIDNAVKSIFGYKFGQRPVIAATRLLRQMTYRGMLGLNLSSAMRNISQGINTFAVLGGKYTTIGYAKLFNPSNLKELTEQGVLSQGFIQDRILSSTRRAVEKIDKVLFVFFDTAEKINRGSAYFGAKAKAIAEGKTEEQAIEYAKEIVAKTQFKFGSIDIPVGLQSDIMKTLFQFQNYTLKQVEFLTEMAMDKNFFGLLRYGLAGMLFILTIGRAFGMKPEELIPTFRLGIPPSLKLPAETGKAIFNIPDKYGNIPNLSKKVDNILNTLYGLIPGGTQFKKTFQGIEAMRQGKSTTKSGVSQFEVGGSLPQNIQAILFGKYASQEAQDYFSGTSFTEATYKKIKNLSPKEANAFMSALWTENKPLYQRIAAMKKDEELGVTDKEKEIRNLGVENEARAQRVLKELQKLKTAEEKNALISDWWKKKIITQKVYDQLKALLK